jgi:hypothetical protein
MPSRPGGGFRCRRRASSCPACDHDARRAAGGSCRRQVRDPDSRLPYAILTRLGSSAARRLGGPGRPLATLRTGGHRCGRPNGRIVGSGTAEVCPAQIGSPEQSPRSPGGWSGGPPWRSPCWWPPRSPRTRWTTPERRPATSSGCRWSPRCCRSSRSGSAGWPGGGPGGGGSHHRLGTAARARRRRRVPAGGVHRHCRGQPAAAAVHQRLNVGRGVAVRPRPIAMIIRE